MTSFHFERCLRKVNYRINHAEGQAETSLQVLHACMNIFHFWLTQYVTIAVCSGRKEEWGGWRKKRSEKKSTLLNWCTTHVSASWLGRQIRGKCRKICFLQQCPHFPFNSGYSGFWPVKTEAVTHTSNLPSISDIKSNQTTNFKTVFSAPGFHPARLTLAQTFGFFFIWDISASALLRS